jgi:hypothetical protein
VTEGLALWVTWVLVAILVVAVMAAILIAGRRVVLERGGGTVECGLRRIPEQNWRLGLAAYQPHELCWFNVFGIRLKPEAVFARSSLSIVSRRPAGPAEISSLGSGAVVMECRVGPGGPNGTQGGPGIGMVELAMTEAALTGFLAWLEAAPPGHVSA